MLDGGFFPNKETPCGIGSTAENTVLSRKAVKEAIELTNASRINDAGCGDRGYWDWEGYDVIAYDWIPWVDGVTRLDITKKAMRPCDLVLCRYVFIHLRASQIASALSLMDAQYLLATRSYGEPEHSDEERDYRRVDLGRQPFNLEYVEYWPDCESELVLYKLCLSNS